MRSVFLSMIGYMCLVFMYCITKYTPWLCAATGVFDTIMSALFILSLVFNAASFVLAVVDFCRMTSATRSIFSVFSMMMSAPYIIVVAMHLKIAD